MANQPSNSRCLLLPLPVTENRKELRGGDDKAATAGRRSSRDGTKNFAAKSFTETNKAMRLKQQPKLTRTMYNRLRRNSLLATIALTFVVASITTSDQQQQVSCQPTDTMTADSNVTIRRESNLSPVALATATDLVADHQLIEGAEPRQYFRLHVAPKSPSKGSLKKAQVARRTIAAAGSSSKPLVVAVNAASASASAPLNTTQQSQPTPAQQANRPKTISNATLKKLLNQSLLKQATSNSSGSNNSLTSPSKTSNFKFVFIQRATASPSVHTTATTGGRHRYNQQQQQQQSHQAQQHSHKSTTVAAPQQAPSLAASVSKHLATSLLNSAATLITNLNTSAPSLSSLASQIVSQSLASNSNSNQQSSNDLRLNTITGGATGNSKPSKQQKTKLSPSSFSPLSSSQTPGDKNDKNKVEDDIKRANQPASSSSTAIKEPINEEPRIPAAGGKKSPNGRPSRPSKIYNLPIKFVANGHPSSLIVFNTIRQHFATMKKLQQNLSSGDKVTHGNGGSGQQQKKRKQHQHQPQGLKLKGNSRLIYLPLKYLSNARPNKLMTSKATHKSNN